MFVRGCLAQQRWPTTAIRNLFASGPLEVGDETDGTAGAVGGDLAALSGEAEVAGTGDAAAAASAGGEPPHINWPEQVRVPQSRFTLDSVHILYIEKQFDPLGGPRAILGIDILRDVISYLESLDVH